MTLGAGTQRAGGVLRAGRTHLCESCPQGLRPESQMLLAELPEASLGSWSGRPGKDGGAERGRRRGQRTTQNGWHIVTGSRCCPLLTSVTKYSEMLLALRETPLQGPRIIHETDSPHAVRAPAEGGRSVALVWPPL